MHPEQQHVASAGQKAVVHKRATPPLVDSAVHAAAAVQVAETDPGEEADDQTDRQEAASFVGLQPLEQEAASSEELLHLRPEAAVPG